ncbi:HpcH/HpaI aldolase/citrate lyase family protein [Limimaricola pyoseonensis]|uniref:Citrate lyase subunit beta / citryl-CoA lyase n=1 Tax=Limimaricola pyoseonensis TaxID=521013 RepID=A0A1G7IJJ9_9RHOB|nr:CoA ester lyase [Limimaricola pyoseonensis]SDF12897.1 citrate lyase subunit beta / citryl-CoA lyase [Limimaricola pyoseonensis]
MSWRSLLYVPANVPRFLERAQARGADALILDLEDAVPDAEKSRARDLLVAHWDGLAQGSAQLVVRINADLLEAARDLDAVVRPGLKGLYVAKARGASMIAWLAAALDRLEAERGMPAGGIGLVPLLEDPTAIERAFEIAVAPRVRALAFGSEDYAAACGMEPTPEALLYARQRLVSAARAAGVAPLGLLDSVARLDHDDLADLVRRSRAFGFAGASAIHPDTIAALNAGFLPGADSVAWAEAVLQMLAAAQADGRGTARLGGRMIDAPMARRARDILAMAATRGGREAG